MARKAVADSAVKDVVESSKAPEAGETTDVVQCPAHGPFEGESCPSCLAHLGFSEHERMRTMLLEAALIRAMPYVAQIHEAAKDNPDAFPKVRDDYLAVRQAIQFSQE